VHAHTDAGEQKERGEIQWKTIRGRTKKEREYKGRRFKTGKKKRRGG
jgi:hypothetical protein